MCKLGCTAYNIQKLYVNALHISHTYTHVFRTCYAVLSQTPHERPPRFYDHPNVILRVVIKEGFYCIMIVDVGTILFQLKSTVIASIEYLY